MPITFETVDDIVEEIADKIGVYEGKYSEEEKGAGDGHPDDCDCRICFTIDLRHRLDQAYRNQEKLKKIELE